MRIRHLLLALAVAVLCAPAHAQEEAFTNRATELKERGAPDARTLSSLAENTPVKVLARGGGWTRVEAGGQQGWVRVFHLRFPVSTQTSSSSAGSSVMSSVTSIFGGGRDRSQEATIATTGIRGLSPEELKNANPDPEALKRMQSYRADPSTAQRFAREGKLAERQVDYDGGGR
jgi:hypothetical protein